MSVKSVRAAVTAALADKKVSLADAEKITRIAGRTSGVSSTEKKEIAKALAAKAKFEPGAKAHLTANVAAPPPKSAPTVKALEHLVNARGMDALTNLKDADQDKFSPALMAGLEKFAGITGNMEADWMAEMAQEMVVGKDKLYVVTDLDWKKGKEHVGFFNSKGEEVARAAVVLKKDDSLTMNWEALGGKKVKAPIGTPTLHAEETFTAEFKKALEKHVDDVNNRGDDLGPRLDASALPPEVRRRYEYICRNASDSTGAEKFSFRGKTLYALHDFSSVTSSYYLTEKGTQIFMQNR